FQPLRLCGDLRLDSREIARCFLLALRSGRAAGEQLGLTLELLALVVLERPQVFQRRLGFGVIEPRQAFALPDHLSLATASFDDAAAHERGEARPSFGFA